MQKPRATEPPSHHRRAGMSSLVMVVLLLALALTSLSSASAQEATPDDGTPVSATPTTDAPPMATPALVEPNALGTVLMQHDFDELPPTPLTVRLLSITLEPGAQSPMHTHPGPEFNMVESGTLTANIDGTAIVGVGPDTSEVTEDQSLGIGQWIMYPAGTGMNLVNETDEDVVLLAAVVLPVGADVESTITYTNGQPTDEDLAGVSFTVLGDGLIQQFPAGSATITIDRLTVDAGSAIPGYDGPAMLSKTSGDLSIRADEGQVQVTRTATPQLQPNAIPGQEFVLADNDAAFFPAGYETISRPETSGELALTRLLIEPESEPANAPATVADITAAETAATDTPEDDGDASATPLGIGAIVAINTDDVNVRAEATTDSDIVDTYPVGTQFEIIGGPVTDEDYVWYEVVGIGELSDVHGWLVTEFMDVIELAPAGSQGEDGSSGSSETPATPDVGIFGDIDLSGAPAGNEPPADIEVGAIVATTDSNVRIRSDANAGADIIVAVPTGTELEVTGGPEEADGYTWYEVQATDDDAVSGWVASDFLEVTSEPGS